MADDERHARADREARGNSGQKFEDFPFDGETFEIDKDSRLYHDIMRLRQGEKQQLRIEALRAAARVVAGTWDKATWSALPDDPSSIKRESIQETTLRIAKQFYSYLESGE